MPGGLRSLWLFVMVLSWSRAMWAEFVFDTTVHSLLRSLVRAAAFFPGVTRQWLFDNPKIVVLERHGDAVRFHPLLLDLAGRFHVQLRLCAVRAANQKGRVERIVRFLRDRFLAGRSITGIEQGNRELAAFLAEIGNARPHPVFRLGNIFPGAACVAALVDRFVQHCHIIDIDADSWRQKEAEQFKPPSGGVPRGGGRRK